MSWLAQNRGVSQDMGLFVLKPGRAQANQDGLIAHLFTWNPPGPQSGMTDLKTPCVFP